jgi:hypothetical protein
MASSAFAGGLALAGYSPSPEREPIAQQDLLKLRREETDRNTTAHRRVLVRLLERTKAEYDRYTAGAQKEPPVLDVLIVSGGGDWGAFGAGFLKGWHKVPAQHPLAKPEFDVVTGVSTGTLIAPFAFLGDEPAIDQIVTLYRNPGADWVKQRGMLYFLPDNISFSEVPGLEREMRRHITMDMVRRIAKAGADGRMLVVNTTNLDDAGPRVFDLVEEAQRAADSGELERIHNIMLASAGIPGAFPFRIIDQELYVDGGVTGNILYGGRLVPAGTRGVRQTRAAFESALGVGGVRGLLLQPLAQRAVGLGTDHAIELCPVARGEADALDEHVVDAPASIAYVHAVVEGNLGALTRRHLRTHDRGAARLHRLAEEGDLLSARGFHLRQVRALEEVAEEGHELRLLLALERLPVSGERTSGNLVEVEHLSNDLPDLAQLVGPDGGIGPAVLHDGHEAPDCRFDRVARSSLRRGPCGPGRE